jgi:hypothetical protein
MCSLDERLGIEPRKNALTEGIFGWGGGIFWLKASMIGRRRAMPLLNYALASALQLTKATGNIHRLNVPYAYLPGDEDGSRTLRFF